MKSPEHGTGGGPAGIDPPPGEGKAKAPAWESLSTEGRRLLLLSYACHPQGDMTSH